MNIKWSKIPFFRLLLPFMAGIIANIQWNNSSSLIYVFIFIFILSSVIIESTYNNVYKNRLFGIVACIILFLTGFQLSYQTDQRAQKHYFQPYLHSNAIITAKINEIPAPGKWIKCRANVIQVDSHYTQGYIQLYIHRDSFAEQLNYGDILAFKGGVHPIEPPKNPHQFDYKSYLRFQNIHHQVFLKSKDWKVVEKGKGNPLFSLLFKGRKNALNTLETQLGEAQFAVGAALILGYRAALTDEVKAAYADTGAIHVLAVSGLHVGIVTMILKWLLGLIFKNKKRFRILQPTILILGIWAFAFLTGASPSVLRASCMFTFVTLGWYQNHPTNIYNNLAISAFILLTIHPYLIKTVGFQLSYLAVIGIVYFYPLVYKQLYVKNRIANYFWELTSVSVGAQIGTLPLSLFYFHQFPTLFFLSGVIVIPAAVLILSLGLLTIITAPILPLLSDFTGFLLNYTIMGVNASIFSIQSLPIGKIDGIWLGMSGLILLFMSIFSFIYFIESRKGKHLMMSVAFLTWLSLIFMIKNIQQQKQQKAIVYHAYQNTLIEFFNGKKSYTITTLEKDDNYQFATQNNHAANGIKKVKNAELISTVSDDFLRYNGAVAYFNEQTFLLLHPKVDWQSIHHLEIDYLILTQNPKVSIPEIAQKITFDMVIIDGSNYSKKVEKWKKECLSGGFTYYDTNEKGAFEVN